MRQSQRDDLAVVAEFHLDELANQVVAWAIFQVRMREIARRGSWVHGGGVAGVVLFHDPEAVR